ncbi:YdeI/OmpD-associated family protein [Winogradskyella endarachnes]|uniref:YdeI/OmpD-associated family protein n=1 Tax=Winogradskyella endarachnes TaxID=2681965 RepID=UPI00293BB2D2|nr:YdeI/OmpD-associated family protein [Winogradskyella endarachnes]
MPKKTRSVWSAVNKKHIIDLEKDNLIHSSGYEAIKIAKQNGSWSSLDDVENGIIPKNLQIAFNNNKKAYNNYLNFAPSYRKSYLYWLNQAKRAATQQKRIAEIIKLCDANIKSRGNW